MGIGSEKYVSLTTYKKDGTPKSLPVWIIELDDGRVGFTTPSSSWKAKRLRNDPRVVLQPCDQRGRVRAGSSEVTGTGEVVDGPQFEQIAAGIKAKYGFAGMVIGLVNKAAKLVGRNQVSDVAIVVTLA